MAKTTKKDFELFRREVERWLEIYGLKGWSVEILHKTYVENSSASLFYRVGARDAEYYLSKDFGKDKTELGVRLAAFHEVTHHLLGKLIHVAVERSHDEDMINAEEHEVIKTLQNTLFMAYENDKLS